MSRMKGGADSNLLELGKEIGHLTGVESHFQAFESFIGGAPCARS